jgi:hypothetical protein
VNLLFENWRRYINEVGDPDDPDDNNPSTQEMAQAHERSTIERAIEEFSFNSGDRKSPQHRWGSSQPIIDYRFDDSSGVWAYAAYFPDGSSNADNWPSIKSEEGEGLKAFLTRVKEQPHQLNLGVQR